MKNLKLVLLSLLFIACCFTSCTNNESVIEEQNIDDSASITSSLSQLRTQFNNQGDIISTENPTGNIVFDFCFDFVYPLNLSYNNGTTVTVNSLEDLVDITINSTENLYISGIEFPFDVEVFSDNQNAIVVSTINNEEEFISLLESCDFSELDCECTEEYNPVCVEITAPDGELFLMTYPNPCYAACDGFTENDFAENCEEDYNWPGGTDCFTFNFPLTIITDNGDTITVNSQEELDTVLYNVYYFDFVYSFDVTLEDGTLLTIGNEEAFLALLQTCFDDDDCPCPANVDPVCVEIELPNGEIGIISYTNFCEAECDGFTENDLVDCDSNNPNDCTTDAITSIIIDCPWKVIIDSTEYVYIFNEDGTATFTDFIGITANGTWSAVIGNTGYPTIIMSDEFAFHDNEWAFLDCNLDNLVIQSLDTMVSSIERNCE